MLGKITDILLTVILVALSQISARGYNLGRMTGRNEPTCNVLTCLGAFFTPVCYQHQEASEMYRRSVQSIRSVVAQEGASVVF